MLKYHYPDLSYSPPHLLVDVAQEHGISTSVHDVSNMNEQEKNLFVQQLEALEQKSLRKSKQRKRLVKFLAFALFGLWLVSEAFAGFFVVPAIDDWLASSSGWKLFGPDWGWRQKLISFALPTFVYISIVGIFIWIGKKLGKTWPELL